MWEDDERDVLGGEEWGVGRCGRWGGANPSLNAWAESLMRFRDACIASEWGWEVRESGVSEKRSCGIQKMGGGVFINRKRSFAVIIFPPPQHQIYVTFKDRRNLYPLKPIRKDARVSP